MEACEEDGHGHQGTPQEIIAYLRSDEGERWSRAHHFVPCCWHGGLAAIISDEYDDYESAARWRPVDAEQRRREQSDEFWRERELSRAEAAMLDEAWAAWAVAGVWPAEGERSWRS